MTHLHHKISTLSKCRDLLEMPAGIEIMTNYLSSLKSLLLGFNPHDIPGRWSFSDMKPLFTWKLSSSGAFPRFPLVTALIRPQSLDVACQAREKPKPPNCSGHAAFFQLACHDGDCPMWCVFRIFSFPKASLKALSRGCSAGNSVPSISSMLLQFRRNRRGSNAD